MKFERHILKCASRFAWDNLQYQVKLSLTLAFLQIERQKSST